MALREDRLTEDGASASDETFDTSREERNFYVRIHDESMAAIFRRL